MADEQGQYFIAVFVDPIDDDDLEKAAPAFDAYRLNETTAVLYAKHVVPTGIIEDALGVSESRPGLILKLNGSYAGYYYKDFWQWLKDD